MTQNKAPPQQASMFESFEQADFERKTAHLPGTLEAAVPLPSIIERYNAAILQGDQSAKSAAREEAERLAQKLNSGTSFAIKTAGGICDQLESATAAPEGTVPLWGQRGIFILNVRGCDVCVEFDGLYGLSELGFSANAVHWDRPFISETGYRSFLIGGIDCEGGGEPVEAVVRHLIESYLDREQKGRLVPIKDECRERHAERIEEPAP